MESTLKKNKSLLNKEVTDILVAGATQIAMGLLFGIGANIAGRSSGFSSSLTTTSVKPLKPVAAKTGTI